MAVPRQKTVLLENMKFAGDKRHKLQNELHVSR